MAKANFKKAYETCDKIALVSIRGWGSTKIAAFFDGEERWRVFSVEFKRGVLHTLTHWGGRGIRVYPDHIDYSEKYIQPDGWINRVIRHKPKSNSDEAILDSLGKVLAFISKNPDETDIMEEMEPFILPKKCTVRFAADAGWNNMQGVCELTSEDIVHTINFI